MKNRDYFKKVANDAGLSQGDDVLESLWEARHDFSVEPPPGYENNLVRSLMSQITPVKNTAITPKKNFFSFQFIVQIFRIPQLSWGLSFVLLVALVMSGVKNFQGSSIGVEQDLMQKLASQSDPRRVNRWLATVGDSAIRMNVAVNNYSGLINDLENNRDKAAVDRALNNVALSMGLSL